MSSQRLPSAWKISSAALAACGLGGVIAVVFTRDADAGLLALLLAFILATYGGLEVFAAYRLKRALHAFAEEMGSPGVAVWTRWGEAGLRWPELKVSVKGEAFRFTVRDLTVRANGESWRVPANRTRAAARDALTRVGRPPPVSAAWTGRVPFPFSGIGLFAYAFLGTGFSVGAYDAFEGHPAWIVVPAFLVLVLAAHVVGACRVRARVQRFARVMVDEGHLVERVDHLEGSLFPRYGVHADAGLVRLEGLAFPFADRFHVTHGERARRVPVPAADDAVGALVRAWR